MRWLAGCHISTDTTIPTEVEPMETTVKDAIKKLAEKAGTEKDSGDSMRLSQSALNLAHVLATFDNLKK